MMTTLYKAAIGLFLLIAMIGLLSQQNLVLGTAKKTLKIIYLNEAVSNYAQAMTQPNAKAQTAFDQHIKNLYDKLVKTIVRKEDLKLAQYALFSSAFDQPGLLKMQLELIEELNIEGIIEASYENCNEVLRNDELSVILLPTNGYTYGFTPSSNLMILYVNCLVPRETIEKSVQWVFAHEYAHTCDTKFARELKNEVPLYSNTVLKDMIFEGKANNFANRMYGDFGQKMDRAYCSKPWSFYKTRLDDQRYRLYDVQSCAIGEDTFFRYDVYVYGTEIVANYIKENSNDNVEDWMKLTPSAYKRTAERLGE